MDDDDVEVLEVEEMSSTSITADDDDTFARVTRPFGAAARSATAAIPASSAAEPRRRPTTGASDDLFSDIVDKSLSETERDAHERELERLRTAHSEELARRDSEVSKLAAAKISSATAELTQRAALQLQRLDASEATHAEQLGNVRSVHEAQLRELRAAHDQALQTRERRAADALSSEKESARQQMAQAKALLESALRAQEKNHEAALEVARHAANDEAERTRAHLANITEDMRRTYRAQLAELERVQEATLAAADRRAAEATASTAALHRAQLAAIGHINGESQQLSSLAQLVHSGAETLTSLQHKLEQETWKAVLKSEKAMLDKERALQEVEARRERAFTDREAIVAEMQRELKLEAQRHTDVWDATQRGWTDMQVEHGALRTSLANRQLELVQLGERAQGALDELLTHISAERQLLSQERAMLRDERHGFTSHVLEHRKDIAGARDKLYSHQKEMAEGQAAQLQRALTQQRAVDDERTALHAQKRSTEYERSLAARERAAIGEYMSTLQHEFVESASERSRLQSVSDSLAQRTRAISLMHKEMALEREAAIALHASAEREAAEVRQKGSQLEEHARSLLRAGFSSAEEDNISPTHILPPYANRGSGAPRSGGIYESVQPVV